MLYAPCALPIPSDKRSLSSAFCHLFSVISEFAYSMSTRLKTFLYYWLPVILYCIAIYIQSDFPASEHIPTFEFSDKILHFLAYAVMGVLFYRAYQTLRIKDNLRMLLFLSVVSASLYGISDEIHQYYVPFRDASIFDVIANVLGAICGVYLYNLWVVSRRQTT
jgi:VanZ family protein